MVASLSKQAQAGVRRICVERGSSPTLNLGKRFLDSECWTVGPERGHRLDDVRHRDNASFQRNLVAFKTLWIAAAVNLLMVLQGDQRYRPRKLHVLQDVIASLGMILDQRELGFAELSRLGKNLSGNCDLANVVQVARDPQSLPPVGVEAQLGANCDGDLRHAPLVAGGVWVAHRAQRRNHLDGLHERGFELPEIDLILLFDPFLIGDVLEQSQKMLFRIIMKRDQTR